jgi:hypothetical protein
MDSGGVMNDNEQFRMIKRPVPVRVRLASGRQIGAIIQCAEQSEHRRTRERVKDLLNGEDALVPLWNETTQSNTLVNKRFIELVELEEPDAMDPQTLALCERRHVSILLSSGTGLRGSLLISTRPGQHRTLDFLNRGERFFYLETEIGMQVVHLEHVITATDLDTRISPVHLPVPDAD